MTFTLTQTGMPGDPVRVATAGGFPTYHSAAYAAIWTAAQQNCRVSVTDGEGNHLGCWNGPLSGYAEIIRIVHCDYVERIKAARDRLDTILKKTALLENLAGELRQIAETDMATDLDNHARRLIERGESLSIFGRPCQVVAAEIIPDGWYEDAYTKAHADSIQMALDSIQLEEHATEEEWLVVAR